MRKWPQRTRSGSLNTDSNKVLHWMVSGGGRISMAATVMTRDRSSHLASTMSSVSTAGPHAPGVTGAIRAPMAERAPSVSTTGVASARISRPFVVGLSMAWSWRGGDPASRCPADRSGGGASLVASQDRHTATYWWRSTSYHFVKAQRLLDLANRRLSSVGGMLTLSPLAVIHPAEAASGVVHPVHEPERSGRVRHARSRSDRPGNCRWSRTKRAFLSVSAESVCANAGEPRGLDVPLWLPATSEPHGQPETPPPVAPLGKLLMQAPTRPYERHWLSELSRDDADRHAPDWAAGWLTPADVKGSLDAGAGASGGRGWRTLRGRRSPKSRLPAPLRRWAAPTRWSPAFGAVALGNLSADNPANPTRTNRSAPVPADPGRLSAKVSIGWFG
jgi:hypothetical protein